MSDIRILKLLSLLLILLGSCHDGEQQETTNIEDRFTDKCGKVVPGRIIGGREALKGKYVWMGALIRDGDTHTCGGSLITDKHILTAAHCVYGVEPADLKVRIGEYDFGSESEGEYIDYDVRRINSHQRFNSRTYKHDIAVITLSSGLESVPGDGTPICLPPANGSFKHLEARVIGWGRLSEGGQSARRLMEVDVPVWNRTDCRRAYGRGIRSHKVLCAGEEGRDACQGDSGGPLMLKGNNNQWSIIGVVSGGRGCGRSGYPGLYTQVNSYRTWLHGIINAN